MVERYRGTGVNPRTRFETIIKATGLVPWPKLMQNLRASRETELMAKFPAKDVASWMGNSVPVAMAHDAMATAENFRQAIKIPAAVASGGQQPATSSLQPIGGKAKTQQKTAPRGPLMFSDGSEKREKWAIQNAKEPPKTGEITGFPAVAVASGGNPDPSLAELLSVWNVLDDAARQDLLAIARGLAGTRQRGNTP